jgi:hypothetical protein
MVRGVVAQANVAGAIRGWEPSTMRIYLASHNKIFIDPSVEFIMRNRCNSHKGNLGSCMYIMDMIVIKKFKLKNSF